MTRMRVMLAWLRRSFLRKPAAARFHERHVADITGVIPGIVMHLSVGAVRAAGNGKNMVFNHARSSNVKRRVREMPPLARFLQIPTVVVVSKAEVPGSGRTAAAALEAVAGSAGMRVADVMVMMVSCLGRGRDESE